MPENKRINSLLFNPFEILSRKLTLIIGTVVVLLTGWLNSFSDTHFDGLLDIHTGLQTSMGLNLAEGFINILIFTLLLFGLDKLVNKSAGNFGILFSQQALARWPYLIVSLVLLVIADPIQRYGSDLQQQYGRATAVIESNPGDELIFYTGSIIMLLIIIWYIVLSYRSFSGYVKTGGWKTITLFSTCLIIAEGISKIVAISLIK